jgi:hypothetical protein
MQPSLTITTLSRGGHERLAALHSFVVSVVVLCSSGMSRTTVFQPRPPSFAREAPSVASTFHSKRVVSEELGRDSGRTARVPSAATGGTTINYSWTTGGGQRMRSASLVGTGFTPRSVGGEAAVSAAQPVAKESLLLRRFREKLQRVEDADDTERGMPAPPSSAFRPHSARTRGAEPHHTLAATRACLIAERDRRWGHPPPLAGAATSTRSRPRGLRVSTLVSWHSDSVRGRHRPAGRPTIEANNQR